MKVKKLMVFTFPISKEICESMVMLLVVAMARCANRMESRNHEAEGSSLPAQPDLPEWVKSIFPEQIGRASCRERVCQYV